MPVRDKNLYSCWPDGFSRYYSISSILKIIYPNVPARILDVGGDSQWMSRFLNDAKVDYSLTIVDTRKPDFKNRNKRISYVQEDFFKLTQREYSANAVINTDVLEHIPTTLKADFIARCIDFAEDIAIFSAPHETPQVTAAESKINELYTKYKGSSQRWLEEHFEFGKPDSEMIRRNIKKTNLNYLEFNTNNIENWFMTFALNFINSEISPLEGMDEMNRFYNETIHSNGDFSGAAYRKIFIVFKNEEVYERTKSELQTFFTPQSTDKDTFIQKVFEMLASNLAKKEEALAQLTHMQKDLEQTRTAYVSAVQSGEEVQRQLSEITSSKLYKVLSGIRSTKYKIFK